jgi:hypothetical protein
LLTKKRSNRYRLLALHGKWRGKCLPTCVRVAAGERSWSWGATTPDKAFAATVFADPRDFKTSGRTLLRCYCDLIADCGLLAGAEQIEADANVEACDASPYIDNYTIGANFIKVGDAALAVDPISSAGVQVAIQLAVAGGACVHTLRCDPGAIGLVTEFWRGELARRNGRHGNWSARFYGEASERFDSKFWRDRGTSQDANTLEYVNRSSLPMPTLKLRLASSVRIVELPCLVDNKIERRRVAICPSLPEPVAFLDGVDLPALLARIVPGMTAAEILAAWSSLLYMQQAAGFLSWVWRRGLVESCIKSAAA